MDNLPVEGIKIKHSGQGTDKEGDSSVSEKPTRFDLNKFGVNLDVPGEYTVKISLSERLRGNFLLVSKDYKDQLPVIQN